MKLEQHHTPTRPRWSLARFDVRIEIECRSRTAGSEVETLWRILLRREQFSPDRERS
jgi:hypothetical protein